MKPVLFLLVILSSAPVFSDVTQSICPEPKINSSDYHKNIVVFLVTILGSKSSACGLYTEAKLTVNPNSISIPSGIGNSSCIEIKCRAVNAKQIINNAKKVIDLSNESLTDAQISKQGQRRIRRGIQQINKIIPDWEKFILKPYSEYSYRDAEKLISKSLEIQTLEQVDLLPNEIIASYLEELRRIEEEKRIAAKKKREEEERKRLLEQQRKANEQQKRIIKEKSNYEENLACIWTLTFDEYTLFLPFRHSNCLWNAVGLPYQSWPVLNFLMLFSVFKFFRRKKSIPHITPDQVDDDSFFKKYGVDGNESEKTANSTEHAEISIDGATYAGETKDGKLHGQATTTYSTLKAKYEGEYKNNQYHGQGTLTSESGWRYEGEWFEGQTHGQGTLTSPDGTIYVGEFKSGQSDGYGTCTFSDGDKYEGEWKNDMRHGQGTFTCTNGSQFSGGWKKDKRHGKVTFTTAKGDSITQQYKNGELDET